MHAMSYATNVAILAAAWVREATGRCPCRGSGWIPTVHDYYVNCGCPVGPHPEREGDVL